MTRKAKRIVSFAVALVSILSLTFHTSAHEVGSGRSYRWYNIGNLPVNADQAEDINSSLIQDSFNEWNEKTGTTTFHWSSFSNSKVDFVGTSTLPKEEDPDEYYSITALTVLRDSNDRWSSYWGRGIKTGFNSGTVYYSIVFVNPAWANSYMVKHELGHVLGLGHTTNVPSIMYPNDGEYDTVQQHDVDDIRNWY